MADGGSETNIREILEGAKKNHDKFTFENDIYVIIQNHKPSRETKTDFYLIEKQLSHN